MVQQPVERRVPDRQVPGLWVRLRLVESDQEPAGLLCLRDVARQEQRDPSVAREGMLRESRVAATVPEPAARILKLEQRPLRRQRDVDATPDRGRADQVQVPNEGEWLHPQASLLV